MNEFRCNKCSKTYLQFKTLRRHVKETHHDEIEVLAPLPKSKFKCEICDEPYNDKKSLSKHERTLHNVEYVHINQSYFCPLCDYQCFQKTKLLLFEHFKDQHNIIMEETEHIFNSFEEFKTWQEEIQRQTNSKFVKNGNGGCNLKRKTKFVYFVCHRSGHFTFNRKRKRNLKNQGSNKINGFCPASLSVRIEECGITSVKFVRTHVGHENDLGHLTLSESERKSIAQKIASNVPFDAILDEVRGTVSHGEVKRVHLLTKMDLSNIENSFKLNINIKKHENDAVSVNTWVHELKECILLYKPQEQYFENYPQLKRDDFVIILMNDAQVEMFQKYGSDAMCIDGTHGLNKYGFELITLMVLDDLRQGFPCAFLISNRSDQDVLSIFFGCIKEKAGVVQPNVFMSDMANSFINAFVHTMSMPKHRLFCTWHVDKAWRKNLSKIKNKDRQVEVYKLLRALLEETDQTAFTDMLAAAVTQLLEDPVSQDFGIYFRNEYVKCVSSWAYCYRLNCGLNTNMHLERMHKTIKYVYFLGKNTKRLDKMLHVLMKFIRDRLYDRIITLYKGKITKKLADLRARHKNMENMSDKPIIEDTDGWLIQSSKGTNMYSVQQISEKCDCNLRCQECETCIHIFSCSCIDYSIKWNMCKHIHLLCRSRASTHEAISVGIRPVPDELTFLTTEICKSGTKCDKSIDKELNDLNSDWNNIIQKVKSKEQLQIVKNHIRSMKVSVEALDLMQETNICPQITSKCSSDDKVPHNKRIIPQRLFSVKKKKVAGSTKSILKPNAEEQAKIAISLLNN